MATQATHPGPGSVHVGTAAASRPDRPDLEVGEVGRAFGDRVALDHVSFGVVPGVMTGLLGPIGAGKRTLIRILLGVLPPRHGEVRLHGQVITMAARRSWGYLLLLSMVLTLLTDAGVIWLASAMYGRPLLITGRRVRVREVLARAQ